ncbi:ABC transporter ATP-binding protein [Paenibacillus sp. GCM10027626]|uniref:ABC transporter ATP-binding protein n=1 Tax=Paenibacillus sp. GCM10027626 TaxID=3273411 RepID=UPI003637F648
MVDEIAIDIQGIRLKRKHFQLGPIDLQIPRGYVTAIVGPNGSGKSSLFRLMMDIGKPESGKIEVLGLPVGGEDKELKQRIGYLPEKPYELEDKMRGQDKAAFISQWYPGWDMNRYQELVRRFEIDPSLKLGKMSKGMRRKFDLLVTLAHNPELLLLDEPSSGLDPIAWRTMIDAITNYMERGDRTVLIASHIIDEIKRLADYIVFIIHGRVLGVYEKDALLESWYAYYIDTRSGFNRWKSIPGFCGLEEQGGNRVKVISNDAQRAEEWLQTEELQLLGRQKLELDDILAVLIEQERKQIRS